MSTLRVVTAANSFFLNLNKWPIDKAPKVSASSYFVGLGLGLLFHLYAFGSFEKFVFINYNFFSIQSQVLTFVVLVVLALLLSSKEPRVALGVALLLVSSVVIFVFFYYGTSVLTSKWYRESSVLQSRFLVLHWDFYLFVLFFFGWVFKIARKYSVESYTKTETLLYKSLLPTLMLFEAFTFGYLVIWRYINSTLLGYSTVMYLSYYKNYYVADILAGKLFFFLFSCLFLEVIIKNLKMNSFKQAFVDYTFFVLAASVYLFLEFKECWAFLHSVAQANTFKFTYFKYFYFLLMFNFFHAFLAILINYVFLIYFFFKTGAYGDYYETLYFNYKVFYFLLLLTCVLYVSVYVISDLALYGYYA